MKKIFALLMVCAFIITFASGCGNDIPDDSSSNQPTSAENQETGEVTTEPDSENNSTETTDTQDYQAYIKVINDIMEDPSYSYQMYKGMLYDIDKDGIDELLLHYVSDGVTVIGQIWTVQGDNAVCMLDNVTMAVMAGQGESHFAVGESGGEEYLCLYRSFGETYNLTNRWELFSISGSGYQKNCTLEIKTSYMDADGKYSQSPVSTQYFRDNLEISESEFASYEVEEKESFFNWEPGVEDGSSLEDLLTELQSKI